MAIKLKDIPFETLVPTIVPEDKAPTHEGAFDPDEELVAVVGASVIQMLDSQGCYDYVISPACGGGWFFDGTARRAQWADIADTTDHAGYADCAGNADYADSASYADEAKYTKSADYASCADFAVEADRAYAADVAGCAYCAGCADYAIYADCAGCADWASYADFAVDANYADCAGCANWTDRLGCIETYSCSASIYTACDGLYFEFNEQDGSGVTRVNKLLRYGEVGSLPDGAKVLYFT